jgi:hypothetical protein
MSDNAAASGIGVAFTSDEAVATHAGATGDAFVREVMLALRHEIPSWLDGRLAQIDRLHDLLPNWDSYGARRIDPSSIEIAKRVLEALASVDTVEEPTVTATPDGKVAFCWDDGQRSLDLEVCPDGWLDFSYLNESLEILDEEGQTQDLKHLAILLTQF